MTFAAQLFGTFLAAAVAANPTGWTATVSVPAPVQMAIFQNVWKLDRNFDRSRVTTMAVLYQKDYRASVIMKDELSAATEKADLYIRVVAVEVGTPELLEQVLAEVDADVIYVGPLRAVDIRQIGLMSRRRRIRTITAVAAYVEAGIGVGIGIRKNRPLILVNLAGARAEGCDFEAQLLQLARIVGPAS